MSDAAMVPWKPARVPLRVFADAALPLVLALAGVGGLLALAGHNPFEVYRLLFVESFGSVRRIAATLSSTTPLIFTGLATAVAFRAGAFNVGVEGCIFVGGLAAAYVGFTFAGLPGVLLMLLALAISIVVGALWMLVPGVLKARLDVDEVVTTLMLNFTAISLTAYLVNGPLLAPRSGNSAAPHLHFQISTAATFQGSEGTPYVFESFDFLGPESEAQLFGNGDAWKAAKVEHRRAQLPLNDVVIQFAKP